MTPASPTHPRRAHRLVSAILLPVLLSLVGACSSLQVESNAIDADWSQYRTYRWVEAPPAPMPQGSPFNSMALRNRVRGAVDEELQARGFTPTTAGASDLLVAYRATLDGYTEVTQVDRSMGFSGGVPQYARPEYMGSRTETLVNRYESGSLVVGVAAAATRQVLWRGVAEALLQADEGPSKRDSLVRQAVRDMFRGFPKR